jgi:tRNA A-37 threonylcarbamoyl transferase component Bud32
MTNYLLNRDIRETALDLCRRFAGSRKIVAACFYGPHVYGYADEKADLDVLLVLGEHRPQLMSYSEALNGPTLSVLVADQRAFERDVDRGWLGEFIAEKIAAPYDSLINGEYLKIQEAKLKRRFIWELLENLVSEFPELSHELLIQPKYFLYEAVLRRARLFPPMTYRFLNMTTKNLREKNLDTMINGYLKALNELAEEKWIVFSDGFVKIDETFLKAVDKRKVQVAGFLKSVQSAVSLYALSVYSKMARGLTYDQERFMRSQRWIKTNETAAWIEDPKRYLFIQTPLGLVPLSDDTTIKDFLRKAVPSGEISEVQIEGLGGVLNTVYLLKFRRDHEEQKVVVKEYKDWWGFKWFPLALWTLGSRNFAVLGRSRLEREYALNQFLSSQGFPVPSVLYVSPQKRLIFEEFIDGENLVEIVKRIISAEQVTDEEVATIREVGRRIAEAHKLSVALGDCKPENFITAKNGKVYFVDLEQASRNGNQAWDIAEFLYYTGHFVSPMSSTKAAELISKEFIRGYVRAGGAKEIVKKAGSVRYTKVFSVFTWPHVILAISNFCKKAGAE